MGTEVTPERKNIYIEDVQYRASVSEAVGQKMAGAINFINVGQHVERQWNLNGLYSYLGTPQTGVDGAFVIWYNMEIVGISMYNLVAGSGGTTQLDILKHTTSGGAGSSIFSTKPTLSYLSGNNSVLFYDFLNATAIHAPTGCTQPVLTSTSLTKGDMLTMNLTSAQVSGQSCGITLHMRPR